MAARGKKIPEAAVTQIEVPDVTEEIKDTPSVEKREKKLPKVGVPENIVLFGDELIEVKPTKLKYLRERTAVFYHILEDYSLVDIQAMDRVSQDDDRDGDKCLFDWLLAVTDNPELVKRHYNELSTETIEKLISIFKRINRIDEKEAKRKNPQQERGVMG